MTRGNYPPGVYEHSPDAPWNAPDGFNCAHCGASVITDANYNARYYQCDAGAPETKHGTENELCETCECEYSECAECGEWYLEPFDVSGVCYEPSTARYCPECVGTIPDGARFEYVTEYFRPKPCAHCQTGTRRGYAFTDGRRAPFAPEFVPVCAHCRATSTPDVFRVMVSYHAPAFAAHCPQCGTDADGCECGETCNECGRGIFELKRAEQ